MSRRRAFAVAAWLACGSFTIAAGAANVEVLRQTGDIDKRFNIAVLGDGYRAEDQALLRDNAQAIIDHLFGVSPLREYARFFNVKLVHVISKDNGADNGSYGAVRDTALDAHFNCDDIDRLLCIDDAKTQLAAAQDVPEYNFAIVLVNDPKYGGSGGPVCVSSSNEQSFEVLAHEVGHSLAGLADEYSYEGNQPPCDVSADCPEANVTLRTNRDQIKWSAWLSLDTPLPTPASSAYQDVVGLFEGARYTSVGVYRPQQDCKMRDLDVPYCAVCREQFVRSIWSAENIRMVEATQPPQGHVNIDDCEPVDLSVISPPITPSSYQYTWLLDGKKFSSTVDHARVAPVALRAGEHRLSVRIVDATNFVRGDLGGLLSEQVEWQLSVARDDCQFVAGAGGMPGVSGSGSGGVGPSGGTEGAPVAGAATGSSGGAGVTTGGASGGGSSPRGGAGGSSGSAGAAVASGGAAGSEASTAGSPLGGSSAAGDAATGGSARPPAPPRDNKSCGCSVPESDPTGSVALVGLAGAVAFWRRRGRR